MKQTNKKWPTRAIGGALSLLAVFVVITLTGCGEESKSSKTRNNGYGGIGGYGNVPSGSNVLYRGLGATSSYDNSKVQAGLDIFIAQNGGVVAQGEIYSFRINSSPYGGCSIPVGNYNVQTVQPGMIDSYTGVVSGVRIVANGPVTVGMTIHDARFYQATPYKRSCNNELFESDMYAYISVDSINGQMCSYSGLAFYTSNQFTCSQ